jgi:hypothetical protein
MLDRAASFGRTPYLRAALRSSLARLELARLVSEVAWANVSLEQAPQTTR